jgi:hypothetical protein
LSVIGGKAKLSGVTSHGPSVYPEYSVSGGGVVY